LVTLVGCGGGSDGDADAPETTLQADASSTTSTEPPTSTSATPATSTTVEPTSTTPEATTSEDSSTTIAVAKRNDPKVRGKIRDLAQEFFAKYGYVMEAMGQSTEFTEADIDDAINEACQAKAEDFKIDDQEIGMIGMFVGQILAQHGSDVASFAREGIDYNRKVADLVDC
jgi:hypothetical protein